MYGVEDNSITVVVPARRAFATLPQTLDSLYQSTIRPSVIVVEDGVVDRTSDLLSQFPEIILLRNRHARGAAASRNFGLHLVITPYVMFLDADDLIGKDQFAHAISDLEQSHADLCLTPWSFHDQRNPFGVIKLPPVGIDNRLRVLQWLSNCCFPPCAVVWRTASIRFLGGWNENISYNDDADLMIRSFLAGCSIAVAQRGCGYYVQHDSPFRLSRSSADQVDVSSRQIYQLVINSLPFLDDPDAQRVLGTFCYEQARRQYRQARFQCGRDWLLRAHYHGFKGHHGTMAHRVLVRLLGLPIKERLAGFRDSHSWLRHRFG